jgi:hypothetical protein
MQAKLQTVFAVVDYLSWLGALGMMADFFSHVGKATTSPTRRYLVGGIVASLSTANLLLCVVAHFVWEVSVLIPVFVNGIVLALALTLLLLLWHESQLQAS